MPSSPLQHLRRDRGLLRLVAALLALSLLALPLRLFAAPLDTQPVDSPPAPAHHHCHDAAMASHAGHAQNHGGDHHSGGHCGGHCASVCCSAHFLTAPLPAVASLPRGEGWLPAAALPLPTLDSTPLDEPPRPI